MIISFLLIIIHIRFISVFSSIPMSLFLFLIRWKCSKNEKFDDYLGKHGIGFVTRKLVNKVPCTVEILENEDGSWTVNEITAVRTATSTYSIDER